MRVCHSLRIAVSCGLVVLIAALVLGAGSAGAAHPARGKTYTGTIEHVSNVTFAISFKVSPNGRKVQNFSLPNGYPIYCQGGGFGEVQDATAKVSGGGTFMAKLPIYFAPAHQHQGFVKVTGRFGGRGKASGKVITDFSTSHICNGTSQYTAAAG